MPRSPSAGVEADLDAEQRYVSGLYGRLDELRGLAARRLATALRQTGGTPQARSERESAIALHTERLAQLRGVEQGLCFGRLDLDGGRHRYVGRIGLLAEDGADEPLLVDWRAPAARPFYLATAAAPDGVLRRRHLRTRGRTVVGLDDEVLDLDAARETRHTGLASEAALLAAVTAGRTGRMRDIVETIQGEQDRIIRAPMDGVLVVQGGPGTGKTAVALHRAAYLLYTHRRRLATAGVLVVGPNGTFLRYISQVLPTLAETGVLLRTPGDLFPGVSARRAEPAAVAALKGRPEFVGIIAAAVADRQEAPAEGVRFEFDRDTFTVGGPAVAAAREAARASARPHNEARAVFARHLHAAMARAVADRIGHDPYGEENLLEPADVDDIARELSPMAWRLLMRRCPSRSMTVVGDVAQTGDAAGTSSWAAVL
ncbi:MAG TPA: helicase, partial [Pilimelia sp.]|nr:helicase [Pilimelia sp.]